MEMFVTDHILAMGNYYWKATQCVHPMLHGELKLKGAYDLLHREPS